MCGRCSLARRSRLFVDGIDGTIARRIDILNAAPRWSGAASRSRRRLHHLCPGAGLCAHRGRVPAVRLEHRRGAVVILMTSAMYFADNEMKTEDAWFKGFPAVWNLVVFYVFLLEPGPLAHRPRRSCALGVADLRADRLRPSVPGREAAIPDADACSCCWSVLGSLRGPCRMAPDRWVVWTLCAIGVYFLVLGYFRTKPAPGRLCKRHHDRAPDRSAGLGGARHAHGDGDHPRHRQYRLHLRPGVQAAPKRKRSGPAASASCSRSSSGSSCCSA